MDNILPGLFGLAFILILYFIPFLVAQGNEHRQRPAIFILNLLLGWTVLGWVAALVWACTKPAAGSVT
jgi:predicted branched-subunit amino acid permease